MRTDAQVLGAAKFVRPVLLLRSLAFYFLVIVVSIVTTAYPAQASGTVQPTISWTDPWGFTSSDPVAFCNGYIKDGAAVNGAVYTFRSAPVDPITHIVSCYADIAPPSNLLNAYIGSVEPKFNCPVNSQNTSYYGTVCTCNTNFIPNSAATSCVPDCPLTPLPDTPPPFDDKCAQALEDGHGDDKAGACLLKLDARWTNGQLKCLDDKITKLGLRYTGPGATIRSEPYQNHLLAVWNKWIDISAKVKTPEQKQACATIIARVKKEMDWHQIKHAPSPLGDQAPHVQGLAIDIPEDTANAMIDKVTAIRKSFLSGTPIYCHSCYAAFKFDVQNYVNSSVINPPACNLRWGGDFIKYDPVHFQLPKK